MALNKGKHIVEEINGVRCTIVEKGLDEKRAGFLKELLKHNHFEVHIQEEKKEDETASTTFTLGVTDLVFNPVIAVYQMRLRTKDGKKVSPAYWNQWTRIQVDNRYWRYYPKGEKHEFNSEEFMW
ncbi:MAG: hypothetical protein PHD61_09215 [Bacteroidales bacterium]|nr:hypothetical protein [Lentimicrobiaceae bacterium]MDD5695464.1 hypothetical protein [Bacteroidales bacterium]